MCVLLVGWCIVIIYVDVYLLINIAPYKDLSAATV